MPRTSTIKPPVRSRSARKPARQPSAIAALLAFVGQVFRNYHHTGAVLPSSTALGRAMTRSLRRDSAGPKRLLEVGPGTGPFTNFILDALRPGDELHIVEINPVFARRLDSKLLQPYRAANPNVQVLLHCQAIEAARIDGEFDYIVCGLPFNNFPPNVVRSIFRRLLKLLAPGGELAYFEYAGVRVMKGSIVGPEGRKKLASIGAVGKVLSRRHRGERELVLNNVPPAVAVRLTR